MDFKQSKKNWNDADSKDRKTIRRFTSLSRSDLLIMYSALNDKDKRHLLGWEDVKAIADLIVVEKKRDNLTILINTQGGEIQAAMALMKMLRSKYKQITCVIFGVAKSAGAFIALSSDDCYMHIDSVVSDFTLAPKIATTTEVHARYMRSCHELFSKGLSKKLGNFTLGIEAFWTLTNTFDNHGASINRDEIEKCLPVKKTEEYNHLITHLKYIHNELLRSIGGAGQPVKVVGLNDLVIAPDPQKPAIAAKTAQKTAPHQEENKVEK